MPSTNIPIKPKPRSSNCISLTKTCHDYADESSIHGIRFFAGSNRAHTIVRAAWLLIFCVSVGLGLVVFFPIWQQYASMATQTSIDFIQPDRFEFPSITFRNLNSFRKSMIANRYETYFEFKGGHRHVDMGNKMAMCSGDTLYERVFSEAFLEAYSSMFVDVARLASLLGYLGLLAISTTTSMNSIQMCRFQGRTLTDEECYSSFQNRVTNNLYAFTFNPAEVIRNYSFYETARKLNLKSNSKVGDSTFPAPLRSMVDFTVNSRGRATSVEFILNAQQHDYCDGGENGGAGFEMQIHSRDVQPVISELMSNTIQLTPGKEITVSITEHHFIRETESAGRCLTANNLDYYKHLQYYDKNACITECISKQIQVECECVAEFAPSAALIELVIQNPTNANQSIEEDLKYYGSMTCTQPHNRLCISTLMRRLVVEHSLRKGCHHCKTPCIERSYAIQTTENMFPARNAMHIYGDFKYPIINYTALQRVSNYSDAVNVLMQADARTYGLSTPFQSIEDMRSNLIYLRIQLEDMNIMVTLETFAISISEMFTQLGGAINLFIGASVLSFVKILHWFLIPKAYRKSD